MDGYEKSCSYWSARLSVNRLGITAHPSPAHDVNLHTISLWNPQTSDFCIIETLQDKFGHSSFPVVWGRQCIISAFYCWDSLEKACLLLRLTSASTVTKKSMNWHCKEIGRLAQNIIQIAKGWVGGQGQANNIGQDSGTAMRVDRTGAQGSCKAYSRNFLPHHNYLLLTITWTLLFQLGISNSGISSNAKLKLSYSWPTNDSYLEYIWVSLLKGMLKLHLPSCSRSGEKRLLPRVALCCRIHSGWDLQGKCPAALSPTVRNNWPILQLILLYNF